MADLPSGPYIVGPLLVTNSLNWAFWGILTSQLAFFLRDVRGRSRNAPTRALEDGRLHTEDFEKHPAANQQKQNKFAFAFRRKNAAASNSKSTFADEDVNPWRRSFVPPPTPTPLAVPSISAFPSAHHHARQRSGKSVPSSFDPYSPTAVHPSPLDTDAQSIFLPSAGNIESPSLYLLLLLYAFYVFICLRTVLGTAQFWRVAVLLWHAGPPNLGGPRWVGIVLADCIGPLIFAMTMAYFIYALYFAPPINAIMTRRCSALRPLSLLKNKTSVNVLPDPYSFPFPQSPASTSHSHSRPPRQPSRPATWQRFLRPNYAEPALLALLTIVVTVCGLIDCVRSLKERPLGAPLELGAISLIWFAGMFALDLVLCVLLCQALGPRLSGASWIARTLRVMGECGGTQLVVAFLALILMVSWRDGRPVSTLPVVAPSVLPAIYAITVFLHASSTYFRPSGSHLRHSSASRVPSNPVASKFENIELGMRRGSRGAGTPVPPTRVDLAAASAAVSTYSTTGDSADGAALRAQALAYGRERERDRERELKQEKEGAVPGSDVRLHMERDTVGGSSAGHLPNPNTNSSIAVPGVGTTGNTRVTETVTERAKAPSVRSGVSGALSLELPTFRKGQSRGWRYGYGHGYGDPMMDEESGSDIGSDEWDEELDLESEENGGTWDYGFANSEREKERERAAATLLSGAGTNAFANQMGGAGGAGAGEGTVISVQGGLAGPSSRPWQNFTLSPGKRSSYPSRRSSWRRSYPHPLSNSVNANGEGDEDDDKVSMLSGVSTRSKKGRRSYIASYGFGPQKRAPRLLPRTPGTLHLPPAPPLPTSTAASMSTDSICLTRNENRDELTSPAGSVLVIGRSGVPREPSIAEKSVDRAASVAATRASTGSFWSTISDEFSHPHHYYAGGGGGGPPFAAATFEYGYGHGYYGQAYPRPVQLPDLDLDLARGEYGSGTGIRVGGGEGGGGKEGEGGEGELGEVLGLGGAGMGGRSDTRSPHPYSVAGAGGVSGEGEDGMGGGDQLAARRRWNVHPLKRIAEMGRLKF